MGSVQFKNYILVVIIAFGFAACTPYVNDNSRDPDIAAIMGGDELSADDPLAKNVALLFNQTTTEICTASILNNQFVLTAAHCLENSDVADLILIFDTSQKNNSPSRRVVDFKAFDDYIRNRDKIANTGDLAVVRFAGGVPKGYRAVKFLPDRGLLTNQKMVTAVGYGTDDDNLPHGTGTLRSATLPILNAAFSQTELTLNQRARVGVCHGDSGGPVFLQVDGQYYLWGVTSRSTNKDNCSEAAVITNALMYNVWIYQTNVDMGR
ncbi:MAG: trypsin-like serine protease [Bdellovibrionaceae bacterium]|nr:trypsin-like serine protease [Pseudobdellovibrionaceae bacterium]